MLIGPSSSGAECLRCRQPFKGVELERDRTSQGAAAGQWRRAQEVRPRPAGNRDHDFELCAFFRKGRCSAGNKCVFAHRFVLHTERPTVAEFH